VLDVRAPSKVLPFWTGSLLVPLVSLAEMFSSVQPKLTREMLLPSFKYRYFTSVKAERELGWKPAISMEQTFRDVYAYYRDCREKGEPG